MPLQDDGTRPSPESPRPVDVLGQPRDLAQALRVQNAILEISGAAITLLKGRQQTWASRAWGDLFGYPMESIQGQDIRSCFPSDEAFDGFWQEAQAALAQRGSHQTEAGMKRADDSLFRAKVLGRRVDPEDPDAGSLWVFEEHREAGPVEAALLASEEKFTKIFQMSPDAIDLTRTADGMSRDLNYSYTKLYGYTPEEFIGHSTLPGDLGVWVNMEDHDRHSAGLKEHGEVIGFEAPLRRKDGSTFIAQISSLSLEIDGEPHNLSITRDITEQKRAEEALRLSEEKFFKIFYLCPDSITINRVEDGVYLDVNQGFTDMFGFTREEVVGRSSLPGDLGIWVDKSDRDRIVAEIQAHGEAIGLEARLRCKDGAVLTTLESCRLLEIHGKPCLLSMSRDISERKQAEGILRETAQRLELATASGKFGIWDRNLLDDTVIWDDRMFEVYGVPRETHLSSHDTWRGMVYPEDLASAEEETRAAIAGERPYDTEFRVACPDGTLRYIKASGIVIRDAEGKAIRMIGINQDCTERKEAEFERQCLQVELQHAEKLESIGSLAGGVAHDMNNVLAAILIMTSVLREKCSDGDPMAKGLDTILGAGQRGRDLVKALTDFARKGLEEQCPLDANEILRKEVELLRHTTLQKVRLELELDASLPRILGDASALGNAIMNLSVNALDAMPQGGTLSFHSRTLPGGKVELAVMDTGQGMTPEILSKAMEPFFTTKPAGKGTGLGLARVYGTIKAHGGSVEIKSKPGMGTTVFLRIPAIPGESGDGGYPQAESTADEVSFPRKILLVDDEDIILETAPLMLHSMGHEVVTASSGSEALHRLDSGLDVDLLLLDHNMPELTGVATLISLRVRHPDLPVILATGFLDEGLEETVAGIPCVWVLKKPYGKPEIKGLLAEIFPSAR
jgi:two-component system, cell cycle sensor histidine kinase and response regulator CckA